MKLRDKRYGKIIHSNDLSGEAVMAVDDVAGYMVGDEIRFESPDKRLLVRLWYWLLRRPAPTKYDWFEIISVNEEAEPGKAIEHIRDDKS